MAHVLLLEPDTVLGSTYQGALEFSGHSVKWCQDAQSAVHSMDARLPDVIITELELAMHNGIEFLYELRSYSEWQKLPVIVVSHVPNMNTSVMSALWKELNISAYHYKPLTKLSDIIHSVEQILAPVS